VSTTSYLHALDGRLRIKSPVVKGAPEKARKIEQQIGSCTGIIEVTANPITGSVLVHYDPRELTQKELLDELLTLGCLHESHSFQVTHKEAASAQSEFGRDLVKTVVLSTLEFTVQRLVYALI
jgi:copper chaperone CopZ